MRLLGIDLGKARIGVAVAETEFDVVTPRSVIEATGTLRKDADLVLVVAKKEEVKGIVVGIPVHDADPRPANVAHRFADMLRESGFEVSTVDEAMTTIESDQAMRDAGIKASQRRRLVDSASACRILTRFMNQS